MSSMPAINACVLSQMRYWPMPALTLEGAAVKTLLHGEALDFFDGDPQELAGGPLGQPGGPPHDVVKGVNNLTQTADRAADTLPPR
jgi:hypothetical protein